MGLVDQGDERATLSASANSAADPDAQAGNETDRDLRARFQSGVLRLVGPLDDRAVRTRHHDDAGQNPATEASIGRFAELIARAVVAGYRDQQDSRAIGDGRPLSIDSLLDGRVADEWTLSEVANQLRLPTNGPFVLVAAEVSSVGSEALPSIESKLRSLDVYSAWRLLPDLHVGIVHVHSQQQLDKVLALVSRLAAAPVGVSARYDDLRETPEALHFAKVMLRSRRDRTSPVALFDGSILAAAAVSAPAVMVKSARAVLDGLADLTDEERDVLLETFRVWQDSEASADNAAKMLFCHPNTVRQRLRRIEKRTGRSLSRPRDVAELCLAFEVHHTLIQPRHASRSHWQRRCSR
jgi:PucR C-terminal helix-turn-helix domain/GGDEF-like domain